jgi:hypothetical protein
VERCRAQRFLKRCEFQVDFANEEAWQQYLAASGSPVVCLHYFCSVNSVCLVIVAAINEMSGSECKPDIKRERDSAKHQGRARP